MGVARVNLWSFLFILVSIFSISTSDGADCEYTINVHTGSVTYAGTNSVISLSLYDAYGNEVNIGNLESWGASGPGHDYFEKGNLDIFIGQARCLVGSVCALKLSSDDSGSSSGWYCDYVEVRKCSLEVSTTGVQNSCNRRFFNIQQWLATDEEPYSLTAVRDYCSYNNKKYLNVEGSDLNVEGSSGNKKDLNVKGSESSNVVAI